MYKYIKKTSFKSTHDLLFTINHIPCKELKKTIKVLDTIYHMIFISGLLKWANHMINYLNLYLMLWFTWLYYLLLL